MIGRDGRTRMLGTACLSAGWGCTLLLRTLMGEDAGDVNAGEIGLLLASFGLTFAGLSLVIKRRQMLE